MAQNQVATQPAQSPETVALGRVKDLLFKRQAEITKVIAGDLTPDRFFRVALGALRKNPDLLKCEPESIYLGVHQAAQLGLEIGSQLGHAYLVPFGNQAQFIAGYRGLIFLAVEAGCASKISAYVVYSKDKFRVLGGADERIEHELCLEADRGTPIGAYAIATLPNGMHQFHWATAADIGKVRESSRSKNSPLWTKWWEEAWRKTAVRNLIKYLPVHHLDKTDRLERALDTDDGEVYVAPVIDTTATSVPAREEPKPSAPPKARKTVASSPTASTTKAPAGTPGAGGHFEGMSDDAIASEIARCRNALKLAAPAEAASIEKDIGMMQEELERRAGRPAHAPGGAEEGEPEHEEPQEPEGEGGEEPPQTGLTRDEASGIILDRCNDKNAAVKAKAVAAYKRVVHAAGKSKLAELADAELFALAKEVEPMNAESAK